MFNIQDGFQKYTLLIIHIKHYHINLIPAQNGPTLLSSVLNSNVSQTFKISKHREK